MKNSVDEMHPVVEFCVYLVLFFCFCLVLFFGITKARADTYINLNVAAYHFDREAVKVYNFNEQNWGGGVHYTTGDVGVMGGMYTNSILRPSWYLLGTYTPVRVSDFKLGLIGGGVSGYELAPVIPAFGLFGQYTSGRYGVNLIVTPDVKEYAVYGFIGLQFTIKI